MNIDLNEFLAIKKQYEGIISSDGKDIGYGIADISYDELNNQEMNAIITHIRTPDGMSIGLMGHLKEGIGFRCEFDDFYIRCFIRFPKISIGNNTSIEGSLSRLEICWNYSAVDSRIGETVKTVSVVHYPLSFLTAHHRSGTKDSRRGHFYGHLVNFNWDEKVSQVEWTDESIEFGLDGFEISLSQSMSFHDLNQGKIGFPSRIEISRASLILRKNKIENDQCVWVYPYAEAVRAALLILEHKNLDWNSIVQTSSDKEGMTVQEYNYLRQPIKYQNEDFVRSPTWRGIDECRALLPRIVERVIMLENSKKRDFTRIIDCLMSACGVDWFSVSFLHWFAILDLFRSIYGHSGKPFPEKFIAMCQDKGIQYEDTFNRDDTGNVIAGSFRFNTIRNNYIHEGLAIDDPQAFNERSKMKALCERLILNFLEIDGDFKCFTKVRFI
jgi:hypothetical protein